MIDARCDCPSTENCLKTSRYSVADTNDIEALVASFPFAHLVSPMSRGLLTTPLPLLLERESGGAYTLVGHFARSNPHVEELERFPTALVIFMGPQGYISPSWFSDRTQAPTWNYATVRMSVSVAIDRSPGAADEAVNKLTKHMEQGRAHAWSGAEMGQRFDRLLPHVIAFQAKVLDVQAKFKLSQKERADVLAEAVDGTIREGNLTLAAAMRSANEHRWSQVGGLRGEDDRM